MTRSILSNVSGAGSSPVELDLGAVLAGAGELLRRHGLTLLGLALILIGGPALIGGTGLNEGARSSGSAVSWGVTLTWSFGLDVLADAVLTATATALALGGSHLRSLPRKLPVILLVGAGAALAQGLGYILLVVPGLILQCMWIVAVPVCVAERAGFGALDRSAALTHGKRWPVFGLLVALLLTGMLLQSGLVAILAAVEGAGWAERAGFKLVSGALLSVVGAAGTAALYLELRGRHDRPEIETVASVFD